MIAEKGLACEERDVSLPQSEHKEPWFMRLNLGEEVPVIIHRDNIISDYDQIIDYVERTFTGGTAAARAQTAPQNLGKPGQTPRARAPPQGTTGYRQGSDAPQEPQSMATGPRGPHRSDPPSLVLRERAWPRHPPWSG